MVPTAWQWFFNQDKNSYLCFYFTLVTLWYHAFQLGLQRNLSLQLKTHATQPCTYQQHLWTIHIPPSFIESHWSWRQKLVGNAFLKSLLHPSSSKWLNYHSFCFCRCGLFPTPLYKFPLLIIHHNTLHIFPIHNKLSLSLLHVPPSSLSFLPTPPNCLSPLSRPPSRHILTPKVLPTLPLQSLLWLQSHLAPLSRSNLPPTPLSHRWVHVVNQFPHRLTNPKPTVRHQVHSQVVVNHNPTRPTTNHLAMQKCSVNIVEVPMPTRVACLSTSKRCMQWTVMRLSLSPAAYVAWGEIGIVHADRYYSSVLEL